MMTSWYQNADRRTIVFPVIWGTMTLIWHHSDDHQATRNHMIQVYKCNLVNMKSRGYMNHWYRRNDEKIHPRLKNLRLTREPICKSTHGWLYQINVHIYSSVNGWVMMTSWYRTVFRITGLLWRDPLVTGGFPSQRDSDAGLDCTS